MSEIRRPLKSDLTSRARCSILVITAVFALGVDANSSAEDENGRHLPSTLAVREDIVISAGDDDTLLVANVSSAVVDTQGSIYLADPSLSCIHKLSPTGVYLTRFGQLGEGPGDLMPAVVLAIDRQDRLIIAGVGGRVDLLDLNGTYLTGFERENPESAARSIAVSPDGSVVVAAADMLEGTVLDYYSPTHQHARSAGKTFAAGRDLDWRFESVYAGGHVACDAHGDVYFLQLAPFELVKYAAASAVIQSTSEPGCDFVPFPPDPDVSEGRYRVFFSWATTGLAVLADGQVVCSAFRRDSENQLRSQLYLFDSDVNLVARCEYSGLRTVVGADRRGRAILFVSDEAAPRIIIGRVVWDGT